MGAAADDMENSISNSDSEINLLQREIAQKRAFLAKKVTSESKLKVAKLRVQQAQLRAEYKYLQDCLVAIESDSAPNHPNVPTTAQTVHTSTLIADAVKRTLSERAHLKSKSKKSTSQHDDILSSLSPNSATMTINNSAIHMARNVGFEEHTDKHVARGTDENTYNDALGVPSPTPQNRAKGASISHTPSHSMGNVSFMSSQTHTSEQVEATNMVTNSKNSGQLVVVCGVLMVCMVYVREYYHI